VEVGALRGVTEYEPGDLTLTARAGTTMAELQQATAAHGQWLPLDPPGSASGTLGATIATASWGPLAAAFGTPRDQVLGCEVVTGTGDVIRAGGRVVKNVAGFDLTRLMVGGWGTLGIITEATVRLRARPERDETVAIALGGSESVARAWRWLRTGAFAPMAAELLSPRLAATLGVGTVRAPVLLLRAGGNEPLVRELLRSAAMLGDAMAVDTEAWGRLADIDGSDATLRLSAAPSTVAALWTATSAAVDVAGGVAHANLARGVVRCVVPVAGGDESAAALRGIVSAAGTATIIAERGPAWLWTGPSPDAVLQALTDGVRRAFDPDHLLNRGIMGTPGTS
jgi:FAD/FMN-containing dehydrogenase